MNYNIKLLKKRKYILFLCIFLVTIILAPLILFLPLTDKSNECNISDMLAVHDLKSCINDSVENNNSRHIVNYFKNLYSFFKIIPQCRKEILDVLSQINRKAYENYEVSYLAVRMFYIDKIMDNIDYYVDKIHEAKKEGKSINHFYENISNIFKVNKISFRDYISKDFMKYIYRKSRNSSVFKEMVQRVPVDSSDDLKDYAEIRLKALVREYLNDADINYWTAWTFYSVGRISSAHDILDAYIKEDYNIKLSLLKDKIDNLIELTTCNKKNNIVQSDNEKIKSLIWKPSCQKKLLNTLTEYYSQREYQSIYRVIAHIGPDIDAQVNATVGSFVSYFYADSLLFLGEVEKSQRELISLEMSLLESSPESDSKEKLLLEKVQTRLSEIETDRDRFLKRKESYFDIRTARLSFGSLATVLGIILSLVMLLLMFWRWHLSFVQHGRSAVFFDRQMGSRFSQLVKQLLSHLTGGSYQGRRPSEHPAWSGRLISEEEMREQDSRVSCRALEAMRGKHRGMSNEIIKTLEPEEKYAVFIIRGHRMIEELHELTPYPLQLVKGLPLMKQMHPLWAISIFGFVYSLLWWILSLIPGGSQPADYAIEPIVSRLLVAILIIGILSGLRIMFMRTIDGLDELVTMLEKPESLEKLKVWIMGLFRSPWQLFVALVFIGISLTKSHILATGTSLIDFLFVCGIIWMVSPLIWMILRSFSLTNVLCRLDDLKTATNPLSPLKTLGLQSWIQVIGSYAVVGSIILTYGASIPIIMKLLFGQEIEVGDCFWIFLFLPFLVVYWIFPYLRLSDAVKSIKMLRMQFLKSMISKVFQEWRDAEDAESSRLYAQKEKRRSAGETGEPAGSETVPREEGTPEPEPEDQAWPEMSGKGQTPGGRDPGAEAEGYKRQLDQLDRYYDLFQKLDKSPESFIDFNSALELAKVMGLPSLFVAVVTYFFV